jgi:hypothetical protein
MVMEPGQIIILITSVLSTIAMLWKTSKDQTHAQRMFELGRQADRLDRHEKAQADREDRQELARRLREDANEQRVKQAAHEEARRRQIDENSARIEKTTALVAQETKADSQRALDVQTESLRRAIDQARLFTSERAQAAYHEANSVNSKLEKLHKVNVEQAEVLARLVGAVAGDNPVPSVLAATKKAAFETADAALEKAEAIGGPRE